MTEHAANSASPRVLIIGGGIGELALAQGLHQAGIDAAAFDPEARS